MTIYLKYDGIDGDATHGEHKKWISIDSFQFGVGRGISTPVGRGQNRETSEPSVSEVTVTKKNDLASMALFKEALIGEGKQVKIHFVQGTNPGKTYLEYTLENTLISGFSQSSGGDEPMESLSLNFSKIEFKFAGSGVDVKGGTPASTIYDLAEAKIS